MRLRHIIAGVLGLSVVSPAIAQSVSEADLGTRMQRPAPARIDARKLNDEQRGRDVMNKFARCAIDRSRKTIAAAISLNAGYDAPLLAKAASDECLESGEIRFPAALMRGAVFSELYRRALKKGERKLAEFPVEPVDLTQIPQAENKAATSLYYLLWVSDCLAKAHLREMQTIITANTASNAQEAAYSAIIPAIGPCIYEGSTFSVSRAILEAGFGEYLYRSLPAAPKVES